MMSATIEQQFHALGQAFNELTVVTRRACEQMNRLKRAIITIEAHRLGGDWPDRFSLLNRCVRTGVVPENLTDERWEA